MILYLDDRLLHGRILRGWERKDAAGRTVLVSERLGDSLRLLFLEAAGETELLFVNPLRDALPEYREGDFWLGDHPRALSLLQKAGRRPRQMILIGLREKEGRRLSEDLCIGEESESLIGQAILDGVEVLLQPFPSLSPEPYPRKGENGLT